MANTLTSKERKVLRKKFLSGQIKAWGVGGSCSQGAPMRVPPPPQEQSASHHAAPAALSRSQCAITSASILPYGARPVSSIAALESAKSLRLELTELEFISDWMEQYLPRAFASIGTELFARQLFCRQKINELLKICNIKN